MASPALCPPAGLWAASHAVSLPGSALAGAPSAHGLSGSQTTGPDSSQPVCLSLYSNGSVFLENPKNPPSAARTRKVHSLQVINTGYIDRHPPKSVFSFLKILNSLMRYDTKPLFIDSLAICISSLLYFLNSFAHFLKLGFFLVCFLIVGF